VSRAGVRSGRVTNRQNSACSASDPGSALPNEPRLFAVGRTAPGPLPNAEYPAAAAATAAPVSPAWRNNVRLLIGCPIDRALSSACACARHLQLARKPYPTRCRPTRPPGGTRHSASSVRFGRIRDRPGAISGQPRRRKDRGRAEDREHQKTVLEGAQAHVLVNLYRAVDLLRRGISGRLEMLAQLVVAHEVDLVQVDLRDQRIRYIRLMGDGVADPD